MADASPIGSASRTDEVDGRCARYDPYDLGVRPNPYPYDAALRERWSFHALDKPQLYSVPFEVVDRLGQIRELLGLTRLCLSIDMGGVSQEDMLDVTEVTGAEVLRPWPEAPSAQWADDRE